MDSQFSNKTDYQLRRDMAENKQMIRFMIAREYDNADIQEVMAMNRDIAAELFSRLQQVWAVA